MQRSDFFFELPEPLIAQYPSETRTGSRLLYLDPHTHQPQDLQFIDFPELLRPEDLLVFNDTRVMPARLFAHKSSEGKVEILVERILADNRVLAQLRSHKSLQTGTRLFLNDNVEAVILQRPPKFFELQFTHSVLEVLQNQGHIPLPPYIHRSDTSIDQTRYQTVYARELGAVAAPTAGLHFDEALLAQIRAHGVDIAFITLHVGAGTFAPVRVDDLRKHVMHAEYVQVSASVCAQVQVARHRGGRVIAVGTTSVRALETAAAQGSLAPYTGETCLFITPGYHFQCVDALLTNFHLAESTLLMLVCALAGHAPVLNAYHHAVNQRYRFFSYGDAMFVQKFK